MDNQTRELDRQLSELPDLARPSMFSTPYLEPGPASLGIIEC